MRWLDISFLAYVFSCGCVMMSIKGPDTFFYMFVGMTVCFIELMIAYSILDEAIKNENI